MKNDLIIDYNKMFMCAYWIWCSPSPQMFHHFQQVYYDQRYHVCLVQHHVICLVQDRVLIHHQTWCRSVIIAEPEEDYQQQSHKAWDNLGWPPSYNFLQCKSPLDLHCLLRRLNSPLMGPNGLELQTDRQ